MSGDARDSETTGRAPAVRPSSFDSLVAQLERGQRNPFAPMAKEAYVWLKAVIAALDTPSKGAGVAALRATLHAVRDRIGPANAVHLGAQLPTLIRGLFYEGWRLDASTTHERHKAGFLAHVAHELGTRPPLEAERAARAVFAVMWARIDPGEVAKLARILPSELSDLWPRELRRD